MAAAWQVLLGVLVAVLACWLVLLAALAVQARRTGRRGSLRQAARLVPDVLRLLRGLAGDPTLPRGVRLRLGLLLGYLLMPVDLVPDFVPVLGYADDAVVAVLALRSAVRHAGPEALERHWRGSPEGLAAIRRMAGVQAQVPPVAVGRRCKDGAMTTSDTPSGAGAAGEAQPDGIVPDTKDWTWVLHRPCPECGFVAEQVTVDRLPSALRDNATAWEAALTAGDAGTRPRPGTWSPLEYACHVRDVHRLFDERLRLMLTEVDPHLSNWNQDETALAGRYAEQDPAVVGAELIDAADAVARRYESVPPEAWGRRGFRSDGAEFTVETFARYHLHDVVHHVWDVTGTPWGTGRA